MTHKCPLRRAIFMGENPQAKAWGYTDEARLRGLKYISFGF